MSDYNKRTAPGLDLGKCNSLNSVEHKSPYSMADGSSSLASVGVATWHEIGEQGIASIRTKNS